MFATVCGAKFGASSITTRPLAISRYSVLAGSSACQSLGLAAASTSATVAGFFGAACFSSFDASAADATATAASKPRHSARRAPFDPDLMCIPSFGQWSKQNSCVELQLVVDAPRRFAEQHALVA